MSRKTKTITNAEDRAAIPTSKIKRPRFGKKLEELSPLDATISCNPTSQPIHPDTKVLVNVSSVSITANDLDVNTPPQAAVKGVPSGLTNSSSDVSPPPPYSLRPALSTSLLSAGSTDAEKAKKKERKVTFVEFSHDFLEKKRNDYEDGRAVSIVEGAMGAGQVLKDDINSLVATAVFNPGLAPAKVVKTAYKMGKASNGAYKDSRAETKKRLIEEKKGYIDPDTGKFMKFTPDGTGVEEVSLEEVDMGLGSRK